MKEFVSLVVAMEIGKRQIFSYHSNGWEEKKILYQKHEPYRYKLPLEILSWLDKYWAR